MKVLVTALVVLMASTAAASSNYISGKIQGASYVFNQTVQPKDAHDPVTALERDFVLRTSEGKVFFLTNVSRDMKVKAINRDLHVYGDVQDNGTIFVHRIAIKRGDRFVSLCDWNAKVEELSVP